MTAIGWDSETWLIRPGRLAPPVVCLTAAERFPSDHPLEGEVERGLWARADGKMRLGFEHVLNSDPIYGANVAYDMCCALREWPDLFHRVFEAYDDNRVIDVGLSQQLIDNAKGRMTFIQHTQGYSLVSLEKRWLKRDRTAEKGPDAWRLRYRELHDVPAAQWPKEAVEYPLDDAEGPLLIGEAQWDSIDRKYLADSPAQARAAFALQLLMCWGVKTDPDKIERLRAVAAETYERISVGLVAAGLVRKDGTRNIRLAQARMRQICKEAGFTPKLTDAGYEKFMLRVGEKKQKELSPEDVFTEEELIPYLSVDEDACDESGDQLLKDYSTRTQLHNILNTHVPDLLKGVSEPIQPRYITMVESGRTACAKSRAEGKKGKSPTNGFQFQNPKRALDYFPRGVGIRDCFVARPGKLFADDDFGGLELCTGAQACTAIVGYSKLGEALNAGRDPHLDFGAQMLKISYEEALSRKHEKEVKHHRQLAKCFHPDTEVLTKTGWVKLCELENGVEVAAASFSVGGKTRIRWEKPTRLTTRQADELVHLENKNIDLLVTPDHRMAAWRWAEKNPKQQIRDLKTGRMVAQGGKQKDMHLVPTVCTPDELGKMRAWPSVGLCAEGSEMLSEKILRLAVATQADGSYRGKDGGQGKGRTVHLGFTRKRKITRMRELLKGFEYEEKLVGKAKVTGFYLAPSIARLIRDLLDADKTLPWWWLTLSPKLRGVVLDEAQYWDSHVVTPNKSYGYASMLEKNIDVLQAIASITNQKSTKQIKTRGWGLSVKSRANTRGDNIETTRVRWGRKVYCLTLPSDAVLVRYKGKVTITHQCANFGFPGGLGVRGLIGFAHGYGVKLSADECRALRDAWFTSFPEWKELFKWVREHIDPVSGRGQIEQLYVKRVRGGVTFTSLNNTLFQGLGADGAKKALYEVQKRCYVKEEGSVLYGVRPVGFIHDEILAEVDEALAHEQAFEMAKVMVDACNKFLPDVPVKCVPALSKRWSKEAEAIFDKNGRLQPYDLARDGGWDVYWDQQATAKVKWS